MTTEWLCSKNVIWGGSFLVGFVIGELLIRLITDGYCVVVKSDEKTIQNQIFKSPDEQCYTFHKESVKCQT